MASIPIICMVCSASIKDTQFVTHMNSVHGGLSQSEAMQAEKNIPKPQAPIVLDKEAPPSDEFMEVAKMLDEKPKEAPPVPSTAPKASARSVLAVQEERKPLPITLEYNYTGECPKCFISLKTVIVHTAGKCFAVAICMNHGQLKEREVVDLEEDLIKRVEKAMDKNPKLYEETIDLSNANRYEKELIKEMEKPNIATRFLAKQRKEVKKRGKQRSKSIIQHQTTL